MIGIYTGTHGELNFEADLIEMLKSHGWQDVLKNKTVIELTENWLNIVYENNIDKLHNVPFSDTEKKQLVDTLNQFTSTPEQARRFIDGKDIVLERDTNSPDIENAGQRIFLSLWDANMIAGGKSRYQIAEQTIFDTDKMHNDRRSDLSLLFNGLPLIHIELKALGKSLDEATDQIKKYKHEGVFTGLYGLVQVFFAMTPKDVVYFANVANHTQFNPKFYFHWGDISNEKVTDWRVLCEGNTGKCAPLLSIPEAHRLVGKYMVGTPNGLMVARSYQIYAIESVEKAVSKHIWNTFNPNGGYVWCTTGGGKTLTSFKAGEVIIDKGLADKVVFLVDRTELDDQSYEEYSGFCRDDEEIINTKNTWALFDALADKNSKLIITSIQKLSKIDEDMVKDRQRKQLAFDRIKGKRIVFITDEAHRSQFGKMHEHIKNEFQYACFIGFTGTPIFKNKNDKKGQSTDTVFGAPLAIYTIASGIKDENVLGFSPHKVFTYQDIEIRDKVGKAKCNTNDLSIIYADEKLTAIYNKYQNMDMVDIETLLPPAQYDNDNHRSQVIKNILDGWGQVSRNGLFHGIFATYSIPEAIKYYHMFKDELSMRGMRLNITALFDPNIDNTANSDVKEDGLIEIVNDYNAMFHMDFNRDNDPSYKRLKKDITRRLAHKDNYKAINVGEQIDLIIVVDQLLTGFDSKFVNVLYLDKVIESEGLIQAISRTNRVLDDRKPVGIFKYYRKCHTMERNLTEALSLYCEGAEIALQTIEDNIKAANSRFHEIEQIFRIANIPDYSALPSDYEDQNAFKKAFSKLRRLMNALQLQGFTWNDTQYLQMLDMSQVVYGILTARYRELISKQARSSGGMTAAFQFESSLSDIESDRIDADWLEKHFKIAVITLLDDNKSEEEKDEQIAVVTTSQQFKTLSVEDQRRGAEVLQNIKQGFQQLTEGKTFHQYIADKQEIEERTSAQNEANRLGIDPFALYDLMQEVKSYRDLNKNNRVNTLLRNVDINIAMDEYERITGEKGNGLKVRAWLLKQIENFVFGSDE